MMSRQGIWLAGIAIASCLHGVSAMAEEPRPRTVNVSGMAEVSAEPDIARVTLGVESRKPTMEAARAEVVATVDRVLALARELKIDPKQVNATRVQVQPEYRWNENDRERWRSRRGPVGKNERYVSGHRREGRIAVHRHGPMMRDRVERRGCRKRERT